jgi:prepilin-type processing-associated H-X9-DG protein
LTKPQSQEVAEANMGGTSNQLYAIGGNRAKGYHGGSFVYAYADGHIQVKDPKGTWGRLGLSVGLGYVPFKLALRKLRHFEH